MPNNKLIIPWNWTSVNWFKAAIMGSVVWPAVALIVDISQGHVSDVTGTLLSYLLAVAVSVFVSLPVSLPSLVLLVAYGEWLNKRKLSFRRYVLWQNAGHVAIAALTFYCVQFYNGEELPALSVKIIAIVYTLAGLYTWNKMYIELYKRRSHV